MAARIRRRSVPDIWPGFVDAISTLLIIIIFLLMIFTLAQFFLSEVLSGRDAALERLNRQVAELGEMLALERTANTDLRTDLSQLSSQIQVMAAAREAMTAEIETLGNQRNELQSALDSTLARIAASEQKLSEAQKMIEADREALQVQLGTIESLNRDIAALNKVRDALEKRVTTLAASLQKNQQALTATRDRSKVLEAELSSEKERTALAQKEIAARDLQLEKQAAEAQKTIKANRESIRIQLGTIERLNRDIAALAKVRDALEKRVTTLAASLEENRQLLTTARDRSKALEAKLSTEQERTALAQKEISKNRIALSTEREISTKARSQSELLTRQIAALRQQLARLSAALGASEAKAREQNIQVVDLGKRLNAALANKVAELARYRSEFFGKLRDALGKVKGVRIEGDRFVFQSEVLFDSASASMRGSGPAQIRQLANTLKDISGRIPANIDWVLRVDGHTDIRPIRTPQFPSNWELSAARSIAVVKLLIAAGLPPNRLVAAGFGSEHPLNRNITGAALAQNRRIEFKLTNR
jgi:chemotaxis protein MotB